MHEPVACQLHPSAAAAANALSIQYFPNFGQRARRIFIEHAGNFSFPSVPPDSKLVYEMELVDFEPVNEVGLRGVDHCWRCTFVASMSVPRPCQNLSGTLHMNHAVCDSPEGCSKAMHAMTVALA